MEWSDFGIASKREGKIHVKKGMNQHQRHHRNNKGAKTNGRNLWLEARTVDEATTWLTATHETVNAAAGQPQN